MLHQEGLKVVRQIGSCLVKMTFWTCDQRLALCVSPAQHILLLLEEEMRLIRVQAAQVSFYWQVEPQLSGRRQNGLSELKQLPVGMFLAVWEAAYTLKSELKTFS